MPGSNRCLAALASGDYCRRLSVVFAVSLILLPSCSYYSTSGRTAGDIKRISVPYLNNETSEPGIELEITEKVIDGLIDDNTLKVVSDEDADAVLEGTVVAYRNLPVTFNQELQAEQYRLLIGLNMSLLSKKDNSYIWEKKKIQAHSDYYLESATGQNYEDALEKVYRDIVEAILGATVQEW